MLQVTNTMRNCIPDERGGSEPPPPTTKISPVIKLICVWFRKPYGDFHSYVFRKYSLYELRYLQQLCT